MNKNPLRDDGWESIDSCVGLPWHEQLRDENDYGGLGKEKIKPVIKFPIITDINNMSAKSAEYYSSVFSPDVEKFKWVVPNVLAGGPHPFYFSFENNLKAYKAAGFKAIMTTYEEQLGAKNTDGFQYFFLPTADGKAADLKGSCKFIAAMEKINKPVFVHSFTGNGRTATILAAYLMYKNWLTADEAIIYMRLKYSKHAIETDYQKDALHRFAINL
jgi:hypothetical protein